MGVGRMPVKIRNERRKLFATLLNNMANGSFVVGIAAPIAATFYNVDGKKVIEGAILAVGVTSWLCLMFVLHSTAAYILGGLEDE